MGRYLQNLKLYRSMGKVICYVTQGIEKLYDTINKYTPLSRTTSYGFFQKKYMYDADVEYEWALSALENCYTSTRSLYFDRLFSANSAAWLQEKRRTDAQSITPQDKSQLSF